MEPEEEPCGAAVREVFEEVSVRWFIHSEQMMWLIHLHVRTWV